MEPPGQLEFCFPPAQAKERPAEECTKSRKNGIDHDLTKQCAELARSLCPGKLEDRVSVVWNRRMRSTAGRAFWPEGRIELNPRLLDFAPDEVLNTMLHELAHLLAYAKAGRRRIKAHGVEWRQACHELGIPNESATHSLPLPTREMARKWRYTCPACQESIERVRKMKRYAGCYRCCKEHNGGYYHRRFRLVESRIE